MFTGIIKKTEKVESIRKRGGGIVVSVRRPLGWNAQDGQSISVNGICSTVSAIRGRQLVFQYIPETIRKTTVRWWEKGDLVNLEQSMKFGDPIDGHVVMGHVEGVGRLAATVQELGERLFKVEASKKLISSMVPKGSIAVDGVSLTLVDVGDDWFSVALIPYTTAHTSWKERRVGDMVNLETDILGRQRAQSLFAHATKAETKIRKNRAHA